MDHFILESTLFFGSFIVLTIILFSLSKRFTSVPYTVALLVAGYYAQVLLKFLNLDLHISLDSSIIYHILLPILLFESAFNVNVHQFKIQFKTISFFATVGLLLAVFVIAFTLTYAIGLPFGVALLFGAIISSTDPIAVIALFKNLGGPKRLGLVADGESMFNDATGVIAFKLVSTFVIVNEVFNTDKILGTLGDFVYVFFGSMVLGAAVGYVVALTVFKRLREEKLLLTMITVAFSLLVFNGAEYFFHLSGVITVVVAAIILGNYGKPRIAAEAIHIMAEFWESLGFFSISLVFFFATFNLDVSIFKVVPLWHIFAAIGAVLLSRAACIYLGSLVTNYTSFFKDEPNIPMSWQHILNWGGLRGVIPLVLVYSVPKDYEYYPQILAFTFGSLLFTLIVNGLTIKYLLLWLNLHVPKDEEKVIETETQIFEIDESRKELSKLAEDDFMKQAVDEISKELQNKEKEMRKEFMKYSGDSDLMLRSFRIQSLQIQRMVAIELHEMGYLNENVIMEFETELDLQQDALEYPDVFISKGLDKKGHIKSRVAFRTHIGRFNKLANSIPFFKKFFRTSKEDAIKERYMLLRARLVSSYDVMWYINYVKQFVRQDKTVLAGLKKLEEEYIVMHEDNESQINDISKDYSHIIKKYQASVLEYVLENRTRHIH